MSESILHSERDGQEVYILDPDDRPLEHAVDWGVRAPLKICPQHDIVVIRPDHEERVTAGGIVVPGAVADAAFNRGSAPEAMVHTYNQHHWGTVLALGPGRKDDGERVPLDIEVGDRVLYHRASATGIIWVDGTTVVIVHADGGYAFGEAIMCKEEK